MSIWPSGIHADALRAARYCAPGGAAIGLSGAVWVIASGQRCPNAFHGLFNFLKIVEGADAHIPFTATPETRSGSADHAGPGEEFVKKFPGVAAGIDPYIG